MNQSFSWASFSAGLTLFLGTATELLKEHNTWSYFYQTPLGAIHFFILGVAFVAMLAGALGVQLPRRDGNHSERKDDPPTVPSTLTPEVGTTTTTVTKTEKTEK